MTNEPTFSGCVIEARPLGVFHLIDKGVVDDKILAVPHTDPLFNHYHELNDIPAHFLKEVTHFFNVYKDLEQAETAGKGWDGLEQAYTEIERAVANYQNRLKEMFG